MTENLRLLRTLQRISDTARKINATTHPATKSSSILRSLPEHKPLLPILLSHGIPLKLAQACAGQYDDYANRLRLETETRLAPHLAERNDSQVGRVYSFFLKEYSQTLRNWAQLVLDSALKNLKRDSQKLGTWDATYSPILWLPSPQGSSFACRTPQNICPLSPASAPSHAFPTTYPPPLRPPPAIPLAKWRREPAILSSSPSTSTYNLDSLCLRFTKSLVIDENPAPSPQPKASIFSLPTTLKEVQNLCSSPIKPTKRKSSKMQRSQNLPIPRPIATAPPLTATKPHRLSVPPYPSRSPNAESMARKASVPARLATSRHSTASLKHLRSTCRTTQTATLIDLSANRLDTPSYSAPRTPLHNPPSLLGPTLGQTSLQCVFHSLAGTTTPPASLPDLFPEPIITPPTSTPLTPRSFLKPLADPSRNHPVNTSLISPFNCSGSTLGFAPGDFFSKSVFETPLGFFDFCNGIQPFGTTGSFETGLLSAYATF